ncbi:Uncharacterised protein [Raoultella terrigena]|uniref:Cellulose synthase operon protein C n=1 Tax=Raoultella terrigena TaxID=577 RepID=A0A4U9D593_RAOTE|nr:Uncharacterised protein [Raoultella terrigena]
MLEPMASGSKDADSGLRQALLWLGPQSGDQQFYDTWMQRHPQDTEVQNYYRQRLSGQARGEGYANLNSGNTTAAKQQFEQVLQTNRRMRMRWPAWAISRSVTAISRRHRSIDPGGGSRRR